MTQFSNDLLDDNLPTWKKLYQAALLELDSSKLPGRIAEARRAINDRAEETLTNSSLAEHRSLNSALHALQIIEEVAQREKPAA
jgi:hypothetical protein